MRCPPLSRTKLKFLYLNHFPHIHRYLIDFEVNFSCVIFISTNSHCWLAYSCYESNRSCNRILTLLRIYSIWVISYIFTCMIKPFLSYFSSIDSFEQIYCWSAFREKNTKLGMKKLQTKLFWVIFVYSHWMHNSSKSEEFKS